MTRYHRGRFRFLPHLEKNLTPSAMYVAYRCPLRVELSRKSFLSAFIRVLCSVRRYLAFAPTLIAELLPVLLSCGCA